MTGNATNSTASPGPIGPVSAHPLDDLDLDAALAGIVAGITGLDQAYVIPRDQPGSGPRTPDVGATWVSIGVTSSTPDSVRKIQVRDPSGDGAALLHSYWTLDVLAMCYGPRGDAVAKLIDDSLAIEQNRFALRAIGLNFVETSPIRRLPDVLAAGTRRRSDLSFRLVQAIERKYLVLNLLRIQGSTEAVFGRSDGGVPESQAFLTRLPSVSTGGGG